MGIGAMTAVSGQGGREEGREDWAGVYFSNSSSWRSLASRLSFDNGICVPSAATHQGVDVSIVVTNSATRADACASKNGTVGFTAQSVAANLASPLSVRSAKI